jgi:putative intracellular protease/amidase
MKSKKRWVVPTVVAAIAVCIAVVRLLHPGNEAQPPLEETPPAAVSAVETAEAMTSPEIAATTDVLVLMPMAWFDDFEIPAIRQGFRRYPHVAVTYAGPQLGTATSHEGTVDVEIDVAIEDVDPTTYDAVIVLGACTHHHEGKPPEPIPHAELDRILQEADETGRVIVAIWQGIPAVVRSGLVDGRVAPRDIPIPRNPDLARTRSASFEDVPIRGQTLVVRPSAEDGSQSTLILVDSAHGNPRFVEEIAIALGLREP